MQVKLKVLNGSHEGLEIAVPGPEFLIGRQEGCDLRPKSETVSRRHCSIRLTDSGVVVRDLKSRNGVIVNGEKIEEAVLKPGDKLQVGKLQFEAVINYGLGATKKPQVASVKEAVQRVAGKKRNDDSIGDWLNEADEIARLRQRTEPETRQFKLEETRRMSADDADLEEGDVEAGEAVEISSDTKTTDVSDSTDSGFFGRFKGKPKKTKGKLPDIPRNDSKDTREAASDTLRKFFNNR